MGVAVSDVEFRTAQDDVALAHAPVLFPRANTLGKFTDVPLMVYAEQLREGADDILQYTVIFSNEDGGTSTRALMARWGRTTDIEYVYRVNLRTGRAIIQGKDHKDIEFTGRREGQHPLLMPITDNNMVGPPDAAPPVRYQIAPVLVNLAAHSREHVMDERPWTYRVATEELVRERKLRAFGIVDGEKIADPRNYLYVEAKVENNNAGLSVNVGSRTTTPGAAAIWAEWITLSAGANGCGPPSNCPPGTRPEQIAEIGLNCVVVPDQNRKMPVAGQCRVVAVTKAFLLDRDYCPGASLWSVGGPIVIRTGEMRIVSIN